jgi:hypothetical protein
VAQVGGPGWLWPRLVGGPGWWPRLAGGPGWLVATDFLADRFPLQTDPICLQISFQIDFIADQLEVQNLPKT